MKRVGFWSGRGSWKGSWRQLILVPPNSGWPPWITPGNKITKREWKLLMMSLQSELSSLASAIVHWPPLCSLTKHARFCKPGVVTFSRRHLLFVCRRSSQKNYWGKLVGFSSVKDVNDNRGIKCTINHLYFWYFVFERKVTLVPPGEWYSNLYLCFPIMSINKKEKRDFESVNIFFTYGNAHFPMISCALYIGL